MLTEGPLVRDGHPEVIILTDYGYLSNIVSDNDNIRLLLILR